MGSEQSRDARDAADDTCSNFPSRNALHFAADRLPALRADVPMDAAVGDDFDVAVGQQQIDQHAVVVLGVPDPQRREHLERALARGHAAQNRARFQRVLDRETDLRLHAALRIRAIACSMLRQRRPAETDAGPAMRRQEMARRGGRVSCHQRPDAPPPPKPPPPPLNPPPPPKPPPRRTAATASRRHDRGRQPASGRRRKQRQQQSRRCPRAAATNSGADDEPGEDADSAAATSAAAGKRPSMRAQYAADRDTIARNRHEIGFERARTPGPGRAPGRFRQRLAVDDRDHPVHARI